MLQEPLLSERERQVFDRLPKDSRGMIFGPMDPVMATPAALFATVAAGILVAAAEPLSRHAGPGSKVSTRSYYLR